MKPDKDVINNLIKNSQLPDNIEKEDDEILEQKAQIMFDKLKKNIGKEIVVTTVSKKINDDGSDYEIYEEENSFILAEVRDYECITSNGERHGWTEDFFNDRYPLKNPNIYIRLIKQITTEDGEILYQNSHANIKDIVSIPDLLALKRLTFGNRKVDDLIEEWGMNYQRNNENIIVDNLKYIDDVAKLLRSSHYIEPITADLKMLKTKVNEINYIKKQMPHTFTEHGKKTIARREKKALESLEACMKSFQTNVEPNDRISQEEKMQVAKEIEKLIEKLRNLEEVTFEDKNQEDKIEKTIENEPSHNEKMVQETENDSSKNINEDDKDSIEHHKDYHGNHFREKIEESITNKDKKIVIFERNNKVHIIGKNIKEEDLSSLNSNILNNNKNYEIHSLNEEISIIEDIIINMYSDGTISINGDVDNIEFYNQEPLYINPNNPFNSPKIEKYNEENQEYEQIKETIKKSKHFTEEVKEKELTELEEEYKPKRR